LEHFDAIGFAARRVEDSVVAKLKIEIIFFDGQRASPNDFGGRDGIRTQDLLIPDEEKSEIRHGAAIT